MMTTPTEERIAALEAQVWAFSEREADFQRLLDNSGELFWIYDIQGRSTRYVSAGLEQLYGLPSAALYADFRSFLNIVTPEDLPVVTDALERQAQGSPTTIEYRVVHADGSIHWLHSRSVPIYDVDGRHVRTAGIVSDITKRREAEEATKLEHHLLRTIVDLLPESIYIKDTERRKTLTNRTDLRFMGFVDEKDVLGKRDEEIYAPETAAQFRKADEQVLFDGKGIINSEEWLTLDGERTCLLTSKVPLRNESGEIVGLLGVGRNVTELKTTQLALEELNRSLEARIEERTQALVTSEQRLRQVIDLVPHLIYAKDIDGVYILANRAAAAAQGMTPEEVVGRRDVDVQGPVEAATRFHAEDMQVIASGETLSIAEDIVRFHDGSEHILQTVKLPFRVSGHEKPAVLGVGIDITEQKRAEAALKAIEADLRRSHDELQAANIVMHNSVRMKDEFMSTMSHELRTPLSSIIGLTEALQMETYGSLTERQRRSLRLIETSGRELLALINDLLDFSRIEIGETHLQIEQFNAVSLAKIAVDRSRAAAISKRQVIQVEVRSEPLLVLGDQRRYIQIVQNLLSNAIKFTAEEGELGIILDKDPLSDKACITVWDHGIGIEEEDIDRLFRPFSQIDSSLRRIYPGAGMGLALTKRLIELLGGQITVESTAGQGSRFIVFLPGKA
jgi:PAS domain S-box-containing protein